VAVRDCYVLRCELTTETPLEDAFRVIDNPHNLAVITPPWLGFRIVTRDLRMAEGARIDYTISWGGLRMRWRSLITEYDPPNSFVDEQVSGPYAFWRHRHTLSQTAEGTVVADEVRYILPLGALGRLAHEGVVRRQLEGIFRYRQRALATMLGNTSRVKDPWVERGEVDVTRRAPPGGTASPEAHKREEPS